MNESDDDDANSSFSSPYPAPKTREEEDELIDRFLKAIRGFRAAYDEDGADPHRAQIFRNFALDRWRLLSSLLCGWALDEPLSDEEKANPLARRSRASTVLRKGVAWEYGQSKYSIAVLPTFLAEELAYSLEVIETGEISELLLPASTSESGKFRYNMAQSLQNLRRAAVLRVRFLEGSGSANGDAVATVAAAYGVPVSRLQDWSKGDRGTDKLTANEIWECRIAGALGAGRSIASALEDWPPTIPIDQEEINWFGHPPELIEDHIRNMILPYFANRPLAEMGRLYSDEARRQKELAAKRSRKKGMNSGIRPGDET